MTHQDSNSCHTDRDKENSILFKKFLQIGFLVGDISVNKPVSAVEVPSLVGIQANAKTAERASETTFWGLYRGEVSGTSSEKQKPCLVREEEKDFLSLCFLKHQQ